MVLLRLLIMAFLVFGSNVAHAEGRKLALLIGNAAYAEGVGPLKNPITDVLAVRTALNKAGFKAADITTITNASMLDLRREIERFAVLLSSLGSEDVAFIYYAGHGAAKPGGEGYLIPVDVPSADTEDLWHLSVPLAEVVRTLRGGSGTSRPLTQAAIVLVVDACRNELLLPKRAVGGGEERAFQNIPNEAGMLVAFSAKRGQTAWDSMRNSSLQTGPYATALVEELGRPGRTVTAIFGSVRGRVVQLTGGSQEPTFTAELNRDPVLVPAEPLKPDLLASIAPNEWSISPSERLARDHLSDENVELIESLAQDGDARAQYLMSRAHTFGIAGRSVDSELAVGWLQAAAARGLDRAKAELAMLMALGIGVDKNERDALQLVREAAQNGNAFAQWQLGGFIGSGIGGSVPDLREAVRLFRLSEQQGFGPAKTELATFYLSGEAGVSRDPGHALKLLREAIDWGDPRAHQTLGELYQKGEAGLQKDPAEAERQFALAAKGGDARGAYSQAMMVLSTPGQSPGDLATALSQLRSASGAGDMRATADLGWCLYGGRCGEKDEAEGLRLIQRAAAAGDAAGEYYLARLLSYGGPGIERNAEQGYVFAKRAADQGVTAAKGLAAWYLWDGSSVAVRDNQGAAELAREAASAGDALGEYVLGSLMLGGVGGVTRNDAEAVRLIRSAADKGIPDAQALIGSYFESGLFGYPMDMERAVNFYQRSADAGSALGKAYLATMLMYGRGVALDTKTAARLMKESADSGVAFAQATVASWYLNGRAGLGPPEEGVRYAKLAAQSGNASGQFMLGQIYLNGVGGIRADRKEGIRYLRLAAQQGDQGARNALNRLGETW